MSERIVGKGHIVNVVQDDYIDGIQIVVVFLSDGSTITQKREWPDLVYRGEAGNSAHDKYLAITADGDVTPDIKYALIQHFSRLIEGPELIADIPHTEGTEHAIE